MAPDLNALQRKVWENAEAKGWHPTFTVRPRREIRALIVGELEEALEEFRNDKMLTYYKADIAAVLVPTSKPEGFGIELADAAIRTFDHLGERGWQWSPSEVAFVTDPTAHHPALSDDAHFPFDVVTVPEQIDWLIETLYKADHWPTFLWRLNYVAIANGVDLWAMIELKHAYNVTREWRHGGKRA